MPKMLLVEDWQEQEDLTEAVVRVNYLLKDAKTGMMLMARTMD